MFNFHGVLYSNVFTLRKCNAHYGIGDVACGQVGVNGVYLPPENKLGARNLFPHSVATAPLVQFPVKLNYTSLLF